MPGVEVGPSHRHPLAPRPATRADADEVDILRSGGCRLPVDDGDRVRGPITPDQDVLAEELAVDHAVRQTVDQLDQRAVPGEGSFDERSVRLGDPSQARLQVPAPALVEPRRPERQPRQDVPVHPDLATTSAELQPANALGILELPKRVEVLEDRGKDVPGPPFRGAPLRGWSRS